MNNNNCSPLQLVGIFHLEFLRWLSKKVNPDYYTLKGGVNLRFFYKSVRYSEDLDLDVRIIRSDILRNKVMWILESNVFQNNLKPFGIEKIIPPNIEKAKQTQTTQRFKVHLLTPRDEDFLTKIEFSRRKPLPLNEIKIETVSGAILHEYKAAPLLVPHYATAAAVLQKIEALITRRITEIRDIFDIYVLSPQLEPADRKKIKLNPEKIKKAEEIILKAGFREFRDKVISYLPKEEQKIYGFPSVWDEIKLKTIYLLQELKK
jgi:predicted nucleotidyltransferase component of viral defense system